MRKIILTTLSALCFTSFTAQAQGLPEEAVENLSRSVHENLDKARLSDGSVIGERAQDLEYPLVPFEIREEIIFRGSVSGMGEACGMDWQKQNFEPLMIGLRDGKSYSEYQMAFVGMLHGAAMSGGASVIEKRYECSDEVKEKIRTNFILAE